MTAKLILTFFVFIFSDVSMAQKIYKCIDLSGKSYLSDRFVVACQDKEQVILSSNGFIKERVLPAKTDSEKAELKIMKEKDLAIFLQKQEEQRRDKALLGRFPTKKDHDKDYELLKNQIDAVRAIGQKRSGELAIEEVALKEKMKNKDLYNSLIGQYEEVKRSIASQARYLFAQDQELERIRNKFTEEDARLTPLWNKSSTTDQKALEASPLKSSEN